jgi:hypothetical protein
MVVVGGIYSPNHQTNRWGWPVVDGRTGHCPVCQPRHPTVRVLTISTVGALTSWCIGQSGAALDRHCSLSGAPLAPALTSTANCSSCQGTVQSTVALIAVAPLGAPNSSVPHRTVR